MIIGVSGHRTITDNLLGTKTLKFLELARNADPALHVLTGMAVGFDQLVAAACIQLDVPFSAILPFEPDQQVAMWTEQQKVEYADLLGKAKEVVIVSPGGFARWKYHARDKHIVDNSDKMLVYLAVPAPTNSGTYATVRHALKKDRKVFNLTTLSLVDSL